MKTNKQTNKIRITNVPADHVIINVFGYVFRLEKDGTSNSRELREDEIVIKAPKKKAVDKEVYSKEDWKEWCLEVFGIVVE